MPLDRVALPFLILFAAAIGSFSVKKVDHDCRHVDCSCHHRGVDREQFIDNPFDRWRIEQLWWLKKPQCPGHYLVTQSLGVQIHFATKLHQASTLTLFDSLAELFLGAFEKGVFRGPLESISSPSGQSRGLYAFPA